MSKIGLIDAEEYSGILNSDFIEGSYQTTAKVSVILAYLLSLQTNDNPIILGRVDGALDLEITVLWDKHPTLLRAIYDARDQVGGYVSILADYDDPTIIKLNLTEKIGEDKGQELRYSKNIEEITKDEDTYGNVTKIFPIGQADGLPFKLSALFVQGESPATSADATYGYLTLSTEYSYYNGWTGEGNELPDDMIILKDGANDNAAWVQGASARTVRCDIGDYGALSTYTISYLHAEYLMTSPAGDMQSAGQLYPRHDISTPENLLRVAQGYLSNLSDAFVSYNARLPMVPADGSTFDILQLGSLVNIRDVDMGFDTAQMVKRINKPDLRHPERMEVDFNNRLPWFWPKPGDQFANDQLLKDPETLYCSVFGCASYALGIGGEQVGGIPFRSDETFNLRYVRLRAFQNGSFGPHVAMAILKSTEMDHYYDGKGVLSYAFAGQGQFLTGLYTEPTPGRLFLGGFWSERINLNCIIEANTTYRLTLHAPYGDVGAGDFLLCNCQFYSVDNGQNWTPFAAPTNYDGWVVLEVYGVPRDNEEA